MADGEHSEETVEEMEIENNDEIREGTSALFGVDLVDASLPIDVDASGDGQKDDSEDTNGTSSGKRTSACWEDFVPIFDENKVRTHAICKCCGKKFATRASIGTRSLNRHMAVCRKKLVNDHKVQSGLAMNADGLHNWVYDASRARNELCRLIARLDLPLGIGDTQALEDYIKNAHNSIFQKVSR
jgi:hypothetical protein